MLEPLFVALLFVAIFMPIPHLWPAADPNRRGDWGTLDRW